MVFETGIVRFNSLKWDSCAAMCCNTSVVHCSITQEIVKQRQ